MKDALILEHKKYISARRAAEITGYTSDYVGQLCRTGKIESKIVGRSWFVLEDSILKHKEINDQVKTNKKTAKNRRAFLMAVAEKQNEEKVILQKETSEPAFKYEAEESPLMPLLQKTINEKTIKVSANPSSAILVGTQDTSKNLATALVLLLILGGSIFAVQSSMNIFSKNSSAKQGASVASVSQHIVESIFRGWKSASQKFASLVGLGEKSKKEIAKENNSASEINPQENDFAWNGIAVAPSTNSLEKDELMKQRIKDSFSDEVKIYPDQSKTSGIITPVFKKTDGDDFVYVLVPVQEEKQ